MKKSNFKTLFTTLTLLLFAACSTSNKVQGQNGLSKKARETFNKAYNAYQYEEFENAEKLFKQLIKKYPSFIDAYDGLAKTYQEQNKFKPAIATYRQILDKQPNHYYALYELGNLYSSTQRLDSAKYFYNFFLKVNGGKDEISEKVRIKIQNIEFATNAMKNPVDITPINLGSNINSKLEEYMPAFTIDESVMYITQRDGTMHPSRQNEDIYYSNRNNNQWGKIKNIGSPINTIENEGAFSVSADGNYIFFTSCSRPGGVGQCDIWLTMNKNGSWTTPGNIGKPVNSKHWESQPSISATGKKLYFTSDRPGGFGGTDIWVSSFGEEGWEAPVNLGAEINSSQDEQFPFIHPDGITLYYSSAGKIGMGKSDLFISHLKPDNTWEPAQNLGYPINTSGDDWKLVVARDGKTAYYSSDNIQGGFGGMDIYSFELPSKLQAQKVSYVKGHIRDAKSKKPLSASVSLAPLDKTAATFSYAPATNGIFLVALVADKKYALSINKPGYLFHSEHFDMPNVDTDKPFEIFIDLQKVESGNSVVLKNIFFDTDKFELKSESTNELEKLLTFLNNNPTLNIEIGGHTDNIGGTSHNLELSKNRAKSVYNYLITKGVNAKNIAFKGFGDTQPIATNTTIEGRAKNRRTEFVIK